MTRDLRGESRDVMSPVRHSVRLIIHERLMTRMSPVTRDPLIVKDPRRGTLVERIRYRPHKDPLLEECQESKQYFVKSSRSTSSHSSPPIATSSRTSYQATTNKSQRELSPWPTASPSATSVTPLLPALTRQRTTRTDKGKGTGKEEWSRAGGSNL